jgi:hypothetical protein
MTNTSTLPPNETSGEAPTGAISTRDRLLATTIATLDHYHTSRQVMPTGLRLMLEIAVEAAKLDDELAERQALTHLRTMLEIEQLLTTSTITAALEKAELPPPIKQPWQEAEAEQEIAPCPPA